MTKRSMAVLSLAGAGLMVAGCASTSPVHPVTATLTPVSAMAGGTAASSSSPGQLWLQSLQMTSANLGWALYNQGDPTDPASGSLTLLARTADGGQHWTAAAAALPVNAGPNDMCQNRGLSFPTATTGWLTVGCRSGSYVFVSHDGGSAWAPQTLPVSTAADQGGPANVSGPQFTSGKGFLTVAPPSGNPSLLGTPDLGQSWHPLALPAGAEQYPQVSFFNQTQGVLIPAAAQGVLGSVVYTTDDGGQAWTPFQQGKHFTQLGSALDFTGPQTGFAWIQADDTQAATPPPIYATTNSGRTWIPFTPHLVG